MGSISGPRSRHPLHAALSTLSAISCVLPTSMSQWSPVETSFMMQNQSSAHGRQHGGGGGAPRVLGRQLTLAPPTPHPPTP